VGGHLEGDLIVVNTVEGRQKARNLDREPRVAISVYDSSNPYRYIQIRGRVVEKTHEGAEAHIDKMAKKYTGSDIYGGDKAGRVIYKIAPDKVNAYG
jgi:PPOX class probable F420-dependent enzyme